MQQNGPKIAIVADIHHGPNEETKCGDQALDVLDSILTAARDYRPDLLVDLGDRITDETAERDEVLMNQVAKRFTDIDFPRFHLLGNHDVWNLPVATQATALDRDLSHQSYKIDGWHLIFWQANPRPENGTRTIPKEDLDWLRREIERATYPAVLFSHMPIGGGSYVGNYWFSKDPVGSAEHTNAVEARRMVTQSDSVVLAVAGHTHWNTLNTVDGVHFVTVQSVTESYNTHPNPAKAWSTLELGQTIRLSVHGNDPLKLELTPRSKGFHVITREK